jgi:hypothetical protein
MKYYHQLIASLIIAVLLFTGCNPHPGVKEYEAFVYGHSDSIAEVYSEIEYDIHSKEKYEDFQPPEQIEIIIEGKTISGSNGEKIYTNDNCYPEFEYRPQNDQCEYFSVNEKGELTCVRFTDRASHIMGEKLLSQDECKNIAIDFFKNIVDVADYQITVTEEDDLYYVKFQKFVGEWQTTDKASIALFKDGTLYQYNSFMMGRVPADLETSDIDLNRARKAATEKLDLLFTEAKEKFTQVTYDEPIILLTVLEDGTRALLYIVDVKCIKTVGNTSASISELISMVIPIP